MAKGWEEDKAWSDIFILEIQRILGEAFFILPSLSDDQMKNTDLICLDISGKRIGCRVRKKKYLREYAFEFTIRSSRPRGTKTEYQKILEGWGDYFFYGFANNTSASLLHWFVGDLEVFRNCLNSGMVGTSKQNSDGSSGFKSFRWEDVPENFFVKTSDPYLVTTDMCNRCLCPRLIHLGQKEKVICPKCSELSDFTLVIERHKKYRSGKPKR